MPVDRTITERISYGTMLVLIIVMSVQLLWTLLTMQWLNAFIIMVIIGISVMPMFPGRQFPVKIPMEFHIFITTFIFLSIILGEVGDFYERVWWWDIMLHMVSGLLLGVMGFLLVYILNEHDRIEVYLRPRFVALFAFLFAVAAGALWEMFEFVMDISFNMNMQKTMFGDTSGLTDTMWDLIVDMLGAAIISLLGWWYLNRQNGSFMERWIAQLVSSNPRLFMSQKNKWR